jgi:hypothetical protein
MGLSLMNILGLSSSEMAPTAQKTPLPTVLLLLSM